ncbi:hypothetical protein PoB_000224800 [Plakobranchus ocellatus]|uniref:Uncharacterized protein n=1 Tax=Plakobranchus ocellatus TaxID=259542 RepID=A0AAV3Y0F6_9GAST|nr:hypothetical protein PoB_000224800 [Plakobranchus ocellatus]
MLTSYGNSLPCPTHHSPATAQLRLPRKQSSLTDYFSSREKNGSTTADSHRTTCVNLVDRKKANVSSPNSLPSQPKAFLDCSECGPDSSSPPHKRLCQRLSPASLEPHQNPPSTLHSLCNPDLGQTLHSQAKNIWISPLREIQVLDVTPQDVQSSAISQRHLKEREAKTEEMISLPSIQSSECCLKLLAPSVPSVEPAISMNLQPSGNELLKTVSPSLRQDSGLDSDFSVQNDVDLAKPAEDLNSERQSPKFSVGLSVENMTSSKSKQAFTFRGLTEKTEAQDICSVSPDFDSCSNNSLSDEVCGLPSTVDFTGLEDNGDVKDIYHDSLAARFSDCSPGEIIFTSPVIDTFSHPTTYVEDADSQTPSFSQDFLSLQFTEDKDRNDCEQESSISSLVEAKSEAVQERVKNLKNKLMAEMGSLSFTQTSSPL